MVRKLKKAPSKPGVYGNVPNRVYHADRGSVSSSDLKQIIKENVGTWHVHKEQRLAHNLEQEKAIAEAKKQHGKEKDFVWPETDLGPAALRFGSAAHGYILEDIEPEIYEGGKTFDGVGARRFVSERLAKNPDSLFVTRGEYETLQAMREQLIGHPEAAMLLELASKKKAGKPEQSIYWKLSNPGVKQLGRCRPDWLVVEDGHATIVDYKTTRSVQADEFSRTVEDLGYHQSAAWYLQGVTAAGICETASFAFVAQEKTFPYRVGVFDLDEDAILIGQELNEQALVSLSLAQQFNNYYHSVIGIQKIGLPKWSVRRYQANKEGWEG